MNLRRLIPALAFTLFLLPAAARAAETPAEHAANVYAANEMAAAPRHGNLPDYALSPADLAKSQHLSAIHVTLHFVEELWGIVSLLLLLSLGIIAWMRNVALKVGTSRVLQTIMFPISFLELTAVVALLPAILVFLAPLPKNVKAIAELVVFLVALVIMWRFKKPLKAAAYWWVEGHAFLFLYLIAGFLLSLPLSLYAEHLSRVYGLSVQSWPSWFGDQAKAFALAWIIGGLLLMLLFWIIRKLPRAWWLLGWGLSIPIMLFGIFVAPYIEPIFFHYEPLEQSNPALVAKLEEVVQKGHMNIPPERMFLMQASAKTTQLNADVEGFGHSKRVVVWDTTIQQMTTDEIVMVFGHESGHYVLNHILYGIAIAIVIVFVTFFLGYLFVQWAIRRFGPRWGVPSQNDWAALAVLLLAFSLFGLILEPINNTLSRQDEHAADVYGQEAVHGLVADPQAAAQGAFNVLGKTSFADPNPSPFYEFWTGSHPAIGRRAAFAKAYNPWTPGLEPKYFKKQ
jgi:STE24 endopeptidase